MIACCAPLNLWTGSVGRWIQETHGIYSKPIGAEDSRTPHTVVTSECTRMSFEKGTIEEGRILCKMDRSQ